MCSLERMQKNKHEPRLTVQSAMAAAADWLHAPFIIFVPAVWLEIDLTNDGEKVFIAI